MSTPRHSPMQHPSGQFHAGYLLGTLEPRVAAIEEKIAAWEEIAKSCSKRGAIIMGVSGLGYLINVFPNSVIAQYAEALRLALMQH